MAKKHLKKGKKLSGTKTLSAGNIVITKGTDKPS